MDPWGISGPLFLWLYAGAIVVAFILGRVLRKAVFRREQPSQPVSVEEVAYMRGGPVRVVDVALAQLLQTGAVRVQRSGMMQATGMPGRTELEQAIVDFLGRGKEHARTLKDKLRKHPSVRAVRASLEARGLIRPDTFAQTTVVHLPVLVVFGIGIARFVNGVKLDRPVNLLFVFLMITVIILIARWAAAGKLSETKQGTEFQRGLRSHRQDASKRLPVVALTGVAGIVALGGLAAFPDETISVALATSDPIRWTGSSSSSSDSSSSSSSSSCSSSSSSCSSGSSCGG